MGVCGRGNGELASIAADHFTMLRGTWFEVQGDKWYPFEEAEALSIEKKHCGPEMRDKVGTRREGKEGSCSAGVNMEGAILRVRVGGGGGGVEEQERGRKGEVGRERERGGKEAGRERERGGKRAGERWEGAEGEMNI